jgi:predicted nucleic acid-binding protein
MHLIDTNVLIDVVSRDLQWGPWSRHALTVALEAGAAINPIILAELAARYCTPVALHKAFPTDVYAHLDLPWDAAFPTGQAFHRYRQAGGQRHAPLPDFYIGAHAQMANLTLITRDPVRYRTYFPSVILIEPKTHFHELAPKP